MKVSPVIKADGNSQQRILAYRLSLALHPISCATTGLCMVCCMLPVKFAAFASLNVKSKDDAVFGDTVSCLVIRAQTYCCDCHLAAAGQKLMLMATVLFMLMTVLLLIAY